MLPRLKDRKILFFGFSVTEENHGYVFELKRRYKNKINVDSKAIGGLALWAVPYILDNLALENFDEVIFEISTCLRYSESDPQRYIDDLSYILYFCSARNIAVRFLQLYRGDVNYGADKLSNAVTDFCASKGLGEISLIDEMRELDAAGELSGYLRDGTHTTPKGAALYANIIFENLNTCDNQVKKYNPSLDVFKSFIQLDNCSLLESSGKFSRRDIEFTTFDIVEGSKFKVVVPSNCSIVGVWYVKGPKSGILEVSLNGKSYHKIIGYDQFSYYSRFTVWKVPKPSVSEMTIFHTQIKPSTKLVKGERYEGRRETSICGLLVDRKITEM